MTVDIKGVSTGYTLDELARAKVVHTDGKEEPFRHVWAEMFSMVGGHMREQIEQELTVLSGKILAWAVYETDDEGKMISTPMLTTSRKTAFRFGAAPNMAVVPLGSYVQTDDNEADAQPFDTQGHFEAFLDAFGKYDGGDAHMSFAEFRGYLDSFVWAVTRTSKVTLEVPGR